MSTTDELREADRRRRQAMIDADVGALEALLADDLIWTHSSGKTDDKRSFIERIGSKAVSYLELEVRDDAVSSHGGIMVHHGVLEGRVSVDGRERPLRNRFLSVWTWTGRHFELLAWQSTGL
jgi:ketosteroid isomerase-like protein